MARAYHERLFKFAQALEAALPDAVAYDEAINFEALLESVYGKITTDAEAGVRKLISDIKRALPDE